MKAFKEKGNFFNHLAPSSDQRYILAKAWVLLLALSLCLLTSSITLAGSNFGLSKGTQTIYDSPEIPKEYGEVIYHSTGQSSKQLYIIGVEHRDAITRLNGPNTSKVQAEVYKIGEWLILNKELGLLLPEGFFTKKTGKAVLVKSPAEKRTIELKSLHITDLEKRLADNTAYINAEMLLKECYGLRLRQVENKGLYDAVSDALSKMVVNGNNNSCDFLPLKSELDYLQGKRIAAMLQKIPGVIAEEFRENNIKNERALFTIGISHVSGIIKYLNNSKIEVHGPLLGSSKNEDYAADLNLVREKFGITVIVPKKLADNDEILKICSLDKIVGECRKQASSSSPQTLP